MFVLLQPTATTNGAWTPSGWALSANKAAAGDCVMMPLMMQPPPQHQPLSKHTHGEACGPLMHLGKVPLLYWQTVPTLKGSRHHLWLPLLLYLLYLLCVVFVVFVFCVVAAV